MSNLIERAKKVAAAEDALIQALRALEDELLKDHREELADACGGMDRAVIRIGIGALMQRIYDSEK